MMLRNEASMKVMRKLVVVAVALMLLTLFPVNTLAGPQALTSLNTNARGQGTLTVGREAMKIGTVVVNLKEDGTGGITLVADLQLMVSCTWSVPEDLSKGIDLKITGGTTSSGASGSGKLLLKPDGKSIDKLSMQGTSNTSKRKIVVSFVAE
jgi:hypothetical protein